MHHFHSLLGYLHTDRRGIAALEYALLAAMISGTLVMAVNNFGVDLASAFASIGGTLTSIASPTATPSAPVAPPTAPTRHHHEPD
jgi:Flp pilus assembly pilin Flp